MEKYAVKFVEDTRETWTAIQLEQVEQEIEKQKRDWEANRLAELAREEEERKQKEAEENDLLTFSREDAKNQVNNSIPNLFSNINGKTSSAIKNKKLSKFKTKLCNSSNVITNKKQQHKMVSKKTQQKKPVKKSPQKTSASKPVTAAKNVTPNSKKKTPTPVKCSPRKGVTSTPNHVPTRRRLLSARVKVEESESETRQTHTDSDDEPLKHFTLSARGKVVQDDDRDDSECSLDVMIDSNDATADSDSNNAPAITNQVSFQDDEQTLAEDNNAGRRTRSRGTVKINLWNLDESNILPDTIRTIRKRPKLNESQDTSVAIEMHSNDNTENSTSLNNLTLDTSVAITLSDSNAENIPLREFKVLLHRSERGSDEPTDKLSPNLNNKNNKSDGKRSASFSKKISTSKRLKTAKIHGPLDNWVYKTPKVGVSLEDQNICKRFSPKTVVRDGCHENGDVSLEEI